MDRDSGGPAFPWRRDRHPQEALNSVVSGCGMDLRDFFAAISMPIAAEQESRHSKNPSYHGTAHRAYAFADAMIAERNK